MLEYNYYNYHNNGDLCKMYWKNGGNVFWQIFIRFIFNITKYLHTFIVIIYYIIVICIIIIINNNNIINNRNETQNKCIPIFSSLFFIISQHGNHLSKLYFSSCIVPMGPGHPRSCPIIKPLNQGRSCDWPAGSWVHGRVTLNKSIWLTDKWSHVNSIYYFPGKAPSGNFRCSSFTHM